MPYKTEEEIKEYEMWKRWYDNDIKRYGYSMLSHKIKCVHCDEYFYSKNKRKKHCSYRCTNDAYIKWRKEKKLLERQKICKVCTNEFQAKKVDSIYCCVACKQKAYRERKSVTLIS